MPVPYVILSPGPTYNTLGKDDQGNTIIVIKGKATKSTTGHLNLTTVSVTTDKITAFQAFTGWLEHDEVVVPRSAVYPPGQSQKQTDQQNTQDFISSQDSATSAALCELHYPQGFGVISVLADGPSRGRAATGRQAARGRRQAGRPARTSLLDGAHDAHAGHARSRWWCSARARRSPSPSRWASRRPARKGARLGISVATHVPRAVHRRPRSRQRDRRSVGGADVRARDHGQDRHAAI